MPVQKNAADRIRQCAGVVEGRDVNQPRAALGNIVSSLRLTMYTTSNPRG